MAQLKFPLPAYLPARTTLGEAALMLEDLLRTKPQRAHALRTILARCADLSVSDVPSSDKWRKFVGGNHVLPMSTWGVDGDGQAPAPSPRFNPEARERLRNQVVPNFGPDIDAMMRALVEGEAKAERQRAVAMDPKPASPPAGPGLSRDDVARMIAEAVAQHLSGAPHVPHDPPPVRVELVEPGKPPKVLGVQHEQFPTLLKMCSARTEDGHRLNIWLPGPAGSGKTRAAMEAAKALKLAFRFCGALDSAYALLGFVDAHGNTTRTAFREAYEFGGVFLFDEVDASDPTAVLALNAALANGHCAFPDAQIERHKDCVIIAAANTWGQGGTFEYVGRMKQDAAFLSRFVVLPWHYDEKLERAISGNEAWAGKVQRLRAAAAARGVQVVISPRASTNGAALLRVGLTPEEVETATVRNGMDDATWANVKAGVR